jgi:2,3-bisphosphoglycerate-independent phosphoglycerate mutase
MYAYNIFNSSPFYVTFPSFTTNQVAEERAIAESARNLLALEKEIKEAAEAAEIEKERIREEAHRHTIIYCRFFIYYH